MLKNQLELARTLDDPPGDGQKYLDLAADRLSTAQELCEPDPNGAERYAGFMEWFTGSAQERAWGAIHEADILLTYVRPDKDVKAEFPHLRQMIRERTVGSSRDELLDVIKANKDILNRDEVAAAKEFLYTLSDAGYEEKRSFRNIVICMILALVVVTALLAAVGTVDQSLFHPLLRGKLDTAAPALWKIELVGAVAGLIVAIGSLNGLAALRGPYSLAVVQGMLKVPMGALTGLIGALFVQSNEFKIVQPTHLSAFYAWVFVFGAAQWLITRLVDQKAKTVVADAKPGAD
jgi:hypothetical protein